MPINPKSGHRKEADLQRYAAKGVPKSILSRMSIGEKQVKRFLEVPPTKKGEQSAAAIRLTNERAARLLYYSNLADVAFGDSDLARKFMTRKHPRLGVAPIDKLDTEWGGREVEKILNAMIYGLPA
jgi:uncharacterized protein (DUF2384 family)